MKKYAAALAVAAMMFAGSACTAEQAEVNKGEKVAGTNTGSTVKEEAPKDDGIATFGEQAITSDGIAVTVSKPKPYDPSEWASINKGPKNYIVFTVTVVNDSKEPYDPSMFYSTLQSGNAEASTIYDSPVSDTPMTKVLPGREVKWQVAYSVKNPDDLVMEVNPYLTFDTEPVLFATN